MIAVSTNREHQTSTCSMLTQIIYVLDDHRDMHVGEYGDRPTMLGTPVTWYTFFCFFCFHFNDKMAIHGRKAILGAASRVARRKARTGFWHCFRKDMTGPSGWQQAGKAELLQ
ncbi:hypothetical protein LXA43DRAFT_1063888 [Ganoderma leucocontextum]|nr:hypothetical protein LXA43DRAFT_1063888 [Ganoderma leucocontextum]